MQPYPPPGQAAYQIAVPVPIRAAPAAIIPHPLTGRDVALMVLSAAGIVLVLLSVVSPWSYVRQETRDSDGRSSAAIEQQGLLGSASEEEGRLGLYIFAMLLSALACAMAFLGLAGWLALRRWRPKPGPALALGLVSVILCLLAPVLYEHYLPEAKMEAARRESELWGDTFEVPAGASPLKTFYGQREVTESEWWEDRGVTSWGGSVGFYLCIAAGLVFLAGYTLLAAAAYRAMRERALSGY